MKLSKFGEKLSTRSGILELMDDLGKAMGGNEKMIMMGGGNPAHIPAVEKIWRSRMEAIMASGDDFEKMLGNYDTPQGKLEFLNILADFFKRERGWKIGPENIALTNGSQNAFFFLFNMLAGEFADGKKKQILLPLCPEYIGYADQGISGELFTSCKPRIEFPEKHTFKYYIDFNKLKITDEVAAICVSRPTNPTGNVLTNEEIQHLSRLAKENGIPLIVDNAYGLPFPGIIFTEADLHWEEHIILAMSLSKIGLPATRTGIIIASPEIINTLSSINAIVSLATGGIGQSITLPLFEDSSILTISREIVNPYYLKKSQQTIRWIHKYFDDGLDYYVHKSEGALFLWLWFNDLPITTMELYKRLKARKVLIIPGEYFFPGMDENWPHRDQCIRITYSQDADDVHKGIQILAEEVSRAYGEG